MPELPDIYILSKSMNDVLQSRMITGVKVNQEKCLNMTPVKFRNRVRNCKFESIHQRGKWVIAELDSKWSIASNLGMGGEIRLFHEGTKPNPKFHRVVIELDKGDWLGINHWWFGHVHLVPKGDFSSHSQLSKLGPEPLADDFTVDKLKAMLDKKRGRIKSYLLDQSFVAGIGNVYVQDILWYARIHPDRSVNALTPNDIEKLHWAIQQVLKEGIEYGGGLREQDIWGNEGTYIEHRQIGYRTGEPCPECSTIIEEIRVGQTTSYICPHCQV
ncbi:MAG: DNA-formamidopyrimidine glycosylase [Candidatus Thorarchaeota archaeon]|nr:DNA-formamidopyrimidine glycosylase [Candidatus Thorarchaeota archaeon]